MRKILESKQTIENFGVKVLRQMKLFGNEETEAEADYSVGSERNEVNGY